MPSSSSKRIFVLTKNKRPNKEYLWIFVFLSENIFGLKSSKKITKFYLTFFRNLCFLPFSQKVRIVHASQSISYTSSGLRHLFKEIIKVLTFVFWKFKSFADMNENGGSSKKCSWGFNSLVRRKQVDSAHLKNDHGHHQLAKKLTAFDLVAIGIKTKIQTAFVFLSIVDFVSFFSMLLIFQRSWNNNRSRSVHSCGNSS